MLLWIFKYQARFCLSDITIDSLIKFFKIVLSDADQLRFEKFSTSSYMAKKLLRIFKKEKTCAVCSDCNTLYKDSDILPQNLQNVSDSRFKCIYIEFSNYSKYS